MCGINGVIKFNGDKVLASEIEIMNKKIKHRGPDDDGVYLDNNIGLGSVRLAIIDLSSSGHMPMMYKHNGRTAVITYNGEIYNFLEIKNELLAKGYVFNSQCDTEVIIASYFEYGVDCVKKFNGMFAFVIYDFDTKNIFGARDRFGKKPLKYYFDQKKFIFSSELKAIVSHDIPRQIDYSAIDKFLTLQYIPSPMTGFQRIFKLPAAHYFTLNLTTREMKINRFYDLDYENKLNLSERVWLDLIDKELNRAVRSRLIADVPLGAFLSGGIDSSAVVAFMSRYVDKIKTFTIAFDQNEYDESAYARLVAKKFKTEHLEFRIQARDLLQYIDDLARFGEPFADSSCLPTFILSKLTRNHVTVALSGDGGDENFGGYDKYRWHLYLQKYGFYLIFFKKFQFLFKNNYKARVAFNIFNKNIARRHYNFTNYFDEFTKEEFYNDEIKKDLLVNQSNNVFEELVAGKNFSDFDKVFYLDFNSYIPDDINVKIDTESMANALEVRSPFLDYQLVDLLAKMPWQFKFNQREGKLILKKLLTKYLPPEILKRNKKGFSVPIDHWFRRELKEFIYDEIFVNNSLVLKIFKREKIEKLISEHFKGKNHAKKLWTLMVLNKWHHNFFLS